MTAAAANWADFQLEQMPAVWARKPYFRAWATSFGAVKQGVIDLATEAVKARVTRRAPVDALVVKGADRRLERYARDTDEQYRARLENAWPAYHESGTDLGIVNRLAEVAILARCKRNNQWDWDGHPGNVAIYWARMWVIVEQDPTNVFPWEFEEGPVCGGGATCGSGVLCGIGSPTLTSAELLEVIERMRRIVRKWHESSVLVVYIIVVLEGTLCGDGALCGGGATCGGEAAYIPV